MKIPESIRIGGIDYQIEYVSQLNNESRILYGQISYEDSIIKLNSDNQEHQKLCLTLWHEILHGITEHANLEIKNEELVIDVLAKGMYQVLQDNARKLFDITDRGDVD